MGIQALSTYDQFFAPTPVSMGMGNYSFPVVGRAPAQTLNGNPWLQKGSLSPVIQYGERADVLERRSSLTPQEIKWYNTPKGIVYLNQPGIDLALDRRVALFLQQAILCYNMPFTFSCQGADDQIGTASKIYFSDRGQKGKVEHKREAAHSSTIPTLLATDRNGRTFVYLKGGSSHAQHNATIGMHVDVNGADELLDGKGDNGLRSTAIKILNLTAKGLDPIRATQKFLKAFEAKARVISETLDDDDARKAVLETYAQGIREITAQTRTDQALFDRLIDVQINARDPDETVLRKTIYQRRYDVIRFQETVESRIGKRIEKAKKKMDSRDRSLLEHVLLKEFANSSKKKILEKLFAKTTAYFEEEFQTGLPNEKKRALKAFHTRIRGLQIKYEDILDDLKRDLRTDFRELSSSEFAYRSRVFRDLRTRVRDWTQQEFCEKYHTTTGKRVSQAWVSRMEQPSRVDTKISYETPLNQRTRAMNINDANNCAKTFGIDIGLFLPCLFTSS